MTLIFRDDTIAGPATHAFVMGVGAYPFAKPDQGTKPELRTVRDLPSAADSAKLMCDWLLDNRDKLVKPLASLEVLISDPGGAANRYVPRHAALTDSPIDAVTDDMVELAGERWVEALGKTPGNVAFFYACGHGANVASQPVVFLSDLNERPAGKAWSHLNVGQVGLALRQMQGLESGFLFVDACGESVKNFTLAVMNGMQGTQFISVDLPSPTDRDKVCVLFAASTGLLAHDAATDALLEFEGRLEDAKDIRIGRFTQTLLKGLGGASARWKNGKWIIDGSNLSSDFKDLQRAYFPEWSDKPFEPSQFPYQNDHFAIVHPEAPRLPVLVMTNPDALMGELDLRICLTEDGAEPWLSVRDERGTKAWRADIPGDNKKPYWAVAIDPASSACHASFFQANQPLFDHRVDIQS